MVHFYPRSFELSDVLIIVVLVVPIIPVLSLSSLQSKASLTTEFYVY